MDILANLFNPKEKLMTIQIPTGQVNGYVAADSDDEDDCEMESSDDKMETTEYAEEYQKKEQQMYKQMSNELGKVASGTSTEANDDLLSMSGITDITALKQEECTAIYSKYDFRNNQIEPLAIDNFKTQIISLVDTNEAVIIQGHTGCGKTTRVPQFILDDCKSKNVPCKIIITQPRRIAAISVARRVCEERGWALGTVCGYKVGLESAVLGDTLITYVTTGVLLQKLIREKHLNEFTHIIVDEVHERNQDMDFLLLIIRRFLNTNSHNTKVILMSATIDSEQFAQYFRNYSRKEFIPAPILYIGKAKSSFKVSEFYVDQLTLLGEIPKYDVNEPKISNGLFDIFAQLVRMFDKLDNVDPVTNTRMIGNVLVFLPGIYEIEQAHDKLMSFTCGFERDTIDWYILPLHSSITIEEQRKVFQAPLPGKRKIILSTNIAESSITVPDIGYVIDFCMTKTLVLDPNTQYQSLQLQWASKDNCKQRAGRVGRVRDGRVYYMVPSKFYKYQIPENIVPEILRAPLSQTVLLAKMLELNESPKGILALAMNPPNLSNIDNTVLQLKEIGALYMTCNNQRVHSDGDLTFLGYIMAQIPLNVNLSKLIVLGYIFNCLEDCIIMATGCMLSIFKSPFRERRKAYSNILQWADSSCSDLIAYLNLYKVWQVQKRLHNDHKVRREWAKKNYVSERTMNEWDLLIREIKERLARFKITQPEGPDSFMLNSIELPTVIKVVICGAFYPNYFTRSCDGGQVDEREAVKTLGNRDPCSTVYFTGFDSNHPGPLYAKQIKKLFSDYGSTRVSFDNSSKIYVEFLNQKSLEPVNVDGRKLLASMPGKIQFEVYQAVRMRQNNISCRISALDKEKAWEYATKLGLNRNYSSILRLPASCLSDEAHSDYVPHEPILPSLDVQYVIIKVSMIINAGHFWAQNENETTYTSLNMLNNILNNKNLVPVNPKEVIVGGIYAAIFQDDSKYYRVKVISIDVFKSIPKAEILFIDYGNSSTVYLKDLCVLPKHAVTSKPGLAMECNLSEIIPSAILDPRGKWTDKANILFETVTSNKVLYGKVYSVVNGIVRLELYKQSRVDDAYSYNNSLNFHLVKKGFAQPAEESYLSKENHSKRQQLTEYPERLKALIREEEEILLRENIQNIEVPDNLPYQGCMYLKGPFSPLEMRIYSVTQNGLNKAIHTDPSSVNAVLLDEEPQDPHERLIVAAHISQQANSGNLTLRHTTIMPNIHGFVSLMSLLFCPQMEPKPTADGSRLGAVLCGLGARTGRQPLYGQHDICLYLDTDLTASDINQINTLRHCMNISVDTMKANYEGVITGASIAHTQKQLITRLFKLLKTNRQSVERIHIKNAGVWGKTLYNGYVLQPNEGNRLMRTEIWPLLWTIRTNRDALQNVALESHLQELKEVAMSMKTVNEIICQICNVRVYSVPELRVHMTSKLHNDSIAIQKQMNIETLS